MPDFSASKRTANLVCAFAVCATVLIAPGGRFQAVSQTQPDGHAVGAPVSTDSTMADPYLLMLMWPHMGDIKPGAALGIVPDGKGGVWLQHRSSPAILHINSSGDILTHFDATFLQAHGLCQDTDGNFWAIDSGAVHDGPDVGVRGNQVFKYSPSGELLLTLGKAGISKAGPDTFVQPSACHATPDGNIVIADGHWPRPASGPQDSDRLVFYTREGKFIKSFGQHGRKPGEFMGPHGLAYDSQGRLFVADRSNNRIQIFDKNMNFVDEWKQFGRPSGIWITKDDTLIVSDSESNHAVPGAVDAPEGGGVALRNPGWKNGIRIGSAKDGSLRYFIPDTRLEGLAGDDLGDIFGGLTEGCATSASGGCLQKFVKK